MRKFIYITFCLALCLAGCAAGKGSSVQNKVQNRGNAIISPGATNHYKRPAPYQNSNLIDSTAEFDQQSTATERRSQLIAQEAAKVKGVDKVSVVLNNNSALIGVEIRGNIDDAALVKMKKDVEDAVRQADKTLERVAVTASMELTERITKIADFVHENPDGTQPDWAASPVNPDSKAGHVIEELTPLI